MRKLVRGRYLLLLLMPVILFWILTNGGGVVKQRALAMYSQHQSYLELSEPAAVKKHKLVTWNNRTVSLHPDVNTVPATLPEDYHLAFEDCVPLPKSPRQGVVICIHPIQEDKWVSGALKKGQLWEEGNLIQMQKILQADPSMLMVDIGSNIGLYTLYASALGRPVVAVEMIPINVRHIQKALGLSKLGSDVVIVNNALFSDHRTLATKFMTDNLGGTRLNVSSTIEKVNSTHETVYVQTICLDDLTPLLDGATVFMKMDIENSEHHALRCGHTFFQRVNVRYVQMELLFRTDDEREQVMKFMTTHGYSMSTTPDMHTAVDFNTLTNDVYFIKKS